VTGPAADASTTPNALLDYRRPNIGSGVLRWNRDIPSKVGELLELHQADKFLLALGVGGRK
jgi:hypothetical protein